jgi:hypothetical protein
MAESDDLKRSSKDSDVLDKKHHASFDGEDEDVKEPKVKRARLDSFETSSMSSEPMSEHPAEDYTSLQRLSSN